MKEDNKKSPSGFFKESPGSLIMGRKGLLIVAVALIALLLMNLDNFTGSPVHEPSPVLPDSTSYQEVSRQELEIAGRLEKVLAKVSGVGRVEVFLTLERGPEYRYASTTDLSSKETREEDSAGGTRDISESTDRTQLVIIRTPTGQEEPVLVAEVFPEIKGVLVVAQGAQDPRIKESITRAVQTALKLGTHKITVLPMGQ